MIPCDSRLRKLRQSGYRQAIENIEGDCLSDGNPAANIPVAIRQSILCSDASPICLPSIN